MLRLSAVGLVALVVVVMGGMWIQQAMAAESAPAAAPAAGADQGGRRGGDRGTRDPEQMRQRMEEFRTQMATRLKESLGANDEEWKVLQPRIEKVQNLARQSRGGGMGGMMGGRGGFGGDRGRREGGDRPQTDRPASDRPQSDVELKSDALQKVLQNKEAKPEEIKAALSGLREARAKARAELETAQKELREVVTLRQEAQLVTMGMLD